MLHISSHPSSKHVHCPELRRRRSVHEAAHAVVAMVLKFAPVERLIVEDESSTTLGTSDGAYTLEKNRDYISVALAGRAGEEIVFGSAAIDRDIGTETDLAIATRIATEMELHLGLGELGLVYLNADLFAAAHIPGVIPAVRRHVEDGIQRSSQILIQHQDFLERLAGALFRNGELHEADILAVANQASRLAAS